MRPFQFIMKATQAPLNLTGCTIEMTIHRAPTTDPMLTYTLGNGLEPVDLKNGKFRANWRDTAGVLKLAAPLYYYKVRVTFTDGRQRTFLADTFKLR
jgi:hypothetical protein